MTGGHRSQAGVEFPVNSAGWRKRTQPSGSEWQGTKSALNRELFHANRENSQEQGIQARDSTQALWSAQAGGRFAMTIA